MAVRGLHRPQHALDVGLALAVGRHHRRLHADRQARHRPRVAPRSTSSWRCCRPPSRAWRGLWHTGRLRGELRPQALVAGAGMFAAYALVLVALRLASAAAVAAVRETSVVFAARPGGGAPPRAGGPGEGRRRGRGRRRRRPDRPRVDTDGVAPQVSIARLKEFGITPDRELGQNFLVDDNVLELVGTLLPLAATDVVLEVGPGLGVLTSWLAGRVRLVHAIEIDRRLEPALAETPCRGGQRAPAVRRRAGRRPAHARPAARPCCARTCPTTWRRR